MGFMTGNQPGGSGGDPALSRDAALQRISRTRRWMLVSTAALTAALAALASVLLPGKSLGAKAQSATVPSTQATSAPASVTPQLPAPANGAQLGLKAPAQAPQSAPAQSAPQAAAPQAAAPQPAPQAAAPQPAPQPSPAPVSGGS
jgi:DNA polymerase III subunit gamma/tau